MPKWSNIIARPGGGGVGGLMNTLTWNIGGPFPKEVNGATMKILGKSDADAAGRDEVLYWHAYDNMPKGSFGCQFTAPFDMVITKVRCSAYQTLAWGAAFYSSSGLIIRVNGREKRIQAAKPTQTYFELFDVMGTNGVWVDNLEVPIRPIVVPKDSVVQLEIHHDFSMNPFASVDVKIGKVQIGYRAPVTRVDLGFGAKSFLQSRTEVLPEDFVTIDAAASDVEGSPVRNNYRLEGWHGDAGQVTMGEVQLASPATFPPFQALMYPGDEQLKFTSQDGDGDSWLGLNRSYSDPSDLDPGYANTISIPFLLSALHVEKRTPRINLHPFSGVQLHPGNSLQFLGEVTDPDQPGLFDFIKDLTVHAYREVMPGSGGSPDILEGNRVASNGTFSILRVLTIDDLALQRRFSVHSANSAQYNDAVSAIQLLDVTALNQYLLHLLAGSGGRVRVGQAPQQYISGDLGPYDAGTSVSLSAVPLDGYFLGHWELDGQSQTANPLVVVMNQEHTVKPFFELSLPPPLKHDLIIVQPVSGLLDITPGTHQYDTGTAVTVTATPNTGYHFANWTLDGVTKTGNPITVVMDQDHTLAVVFTFVPLPVPPMKFGPFSICKDAYGVVKIKGPLGIWPFLVTRALLASRADLPTC